MRKAKSENRKSVKEAILVGLRRVLGAAGSAESLLGTLGIYRTKNFERLLSLKEKHRGERCFIIGSGPSVKKMDLSPLKNETTFGFNAFYLLEDKVGFLPTYYLVEDYLPAEDNASQISRLVGTTKVFPADLRYCLKSDESTIYVNFDRSYSDYPKREFPRFSDNATKVVCWGGTVAYMALQLAYYMGFKETYLIGIDLTYKVPPHGKGVIITSREKDTSHFHPNYFGPGKRWHQPKVERMQRSFDYAYEFYKSHGRFVYNATVGGKLDSLPRVRYTNLFK